MKRNLDTPIVRLNGEPFNDNPTLGSIAFLAVTATLSGDDALSGEQKMQLYRIAQKVVKGGEVELSAEEISLIKHRAGCAFTVEVVGKVFDLLEAA